MKFRAWDKATKEYYYWDMSKEEPRICPWKSDCLEMSTTLSDKHGKEIFEGDIVMSYASDGSEMRTTVIYDNVECRWNIHKRWVEEFGKVIIGNIHEETK